MEGNNPRPHKPFNLASREKPYLGFGASIIATYTKKKVYIYIYIQPFSVLRPPQRNCKELTERILDLMQAESEHSEDTLARLSGLGVWV